jgi:hypothetical protein
MMAATGARRAAGAAVGLGRAVMEGAREVVAALRAPALAGVGVPASASAPAAADLDALQYESKFTRSVFFLLGTAVSIAVATTWSDALHNLAAGASCVRPWCTGSVHPLTLRNA